MSRETMHKNHNHNRPHPIPKSQKEQKAGFENIVEQYLDSNPLLRTDNKISELEVKFGTNPKVAKPISKIDYDNVVKQLYAYGFVPENTDGINMLRINNQYTDPETGYKQISNVRAEICGLDLIQEYCRTNSLQRLIDMPSTTFDKLKFTRKLDARDQNGNKIQKVDVTDLNMRVSFKTEEDFQVQSTYNLIRQILSKWNDSLKIFRSMNRVRFVHKDIPVFADLTILKTSAKTNGIMIPQYTIQDADVFNGVTSYEVELEVDNNRVGNGTDFNTVDKLMVSIRKCIRMVLSGIQCTKYPIPYTECTSVLESYMKLINEDDNTDTDTEADKKPVKFTSSSFIGPSSFTLQMEHIIETEDNLSPNIRNNYTVTDKADGDRMLLYINGVGKIYMIDTNMNVMFTGTKTTEKTIFDSLLDGEHIKTDKNGKIINLYAAFDVYYIHEKPIRNLPFVANDIPANSIEYRLPLLQKFVDVLNPISILDKKWEGEVKPNHASIPCEFRIQCKSFYYESNKTSIFDGCSKILTDKADGLFEYNTDGLIFTPAAFAVGGTEIGGQPGPKSKTPWKYSFKWKPPEFNTIDFLVSVKQNKMHKDEINHIFQDGHNLNGSQKINQYKTLILQCGYSEKQHGFVNPCQMILDDEIPEYTKNDKDTTYKPVPFQPTNPYSKSAHLCNIMLVENNSQLLMKTEEGEYFDKDTIVEFRYELNNDEGWRWIPLRVRYDKTAELLSGIKKNYGNAYPVANSNWQSIHNPITIEMISTGQNIPEYIDDIYYNDFTEKTNTKPLRDFHNSIKSKLIKAVSKRGHTLIDYAVGRGGDLPKWIHSQIKFVLGIDYAKNNIQHPKNGACSRYLNKKKQIRNIPDALFIHGNSGLNIRDGKSFKTEKDIQIIKAVFGSGPKDALVLGKGVYKNYGIAESGFNISSCQFALHYFFEDITTLHEFLSNIAQCTKLNGYFIGTCYDGHTVFNLLSNKKKDESISIFKNDRKIYELTKKYDKTGFPDDELSINYPINVFQESIGNTFREFLVNFTYFTQLMEDYGFVLMTKEEAIQNGMPNSTGLFGELYSHIENDVNMKYNINTEYKNSLNMTPEEKQISFLNRYFMFKKVRNVDVAKLNEIMNVQSKTTIDTDNNSPDSIIEDKPVQITQDKPVQKITIKKTKKKVILKPFEEPTNDSDITTTAVSKPRLKIIGRRDH